MKYENERSVLFHGTKDKAANKIVETREERVRASIGRNPLQALENRVRSGLRRVFAKDVDIGN